MNNTNSSSGKGFANPSNNNLNLSSVSNGLQDTKGIKGAKGNKSDKCENNPVTNRGLNSQSIVKEHNTEQNESSLTVRIDWLQGTFRFNDLNMLHEVIDFIEGYVGEKYVLNPQQGRRQGKQFNNSGTGIEGSLILYNMPDEEPDSLGHSLLSFPATALSTMKARDIWRMLSGLVNTYNFKTTRIDLAVDDYEKHIRYGMLYDAALNKNFTRFRTKKIVWKFDRDKETLEEIGWTFYFGTKQSNIFIRFYDKDAESKGRIKAHRMEAVIKDETAEAVVKDYLAIQSECFEQMSPMYLSGIVVGAIDFVERGNQKNVSRMPELTWWTEFKNRIGHQIRHSIQVMKTSFERKKEWYTRQVSVTVLMFKKIMGNKLFKQWLGAQMECADERINTYHEKFIAKYKSNADIEFDWDVCNE